MLNFSTVTLLFFTSTIFILFQISDMILSMLLIINTLIICIGFYISLQRKIINIDLIYWIFNYLFFVIAVVMQSKELYFPTTLPVNIDGVIFGQLIIAIWNFVFLVSRNRESNNFQSSNMLVIPKNVSTFYFLLSTMFFFYIFLNNGIQYFYGYGSIISDNVSQPIRLLVYSTVHGAVFANFIFLYSRRKKGSLISSILIVTAFLQLIYIISPFNTNRFNLGFIIVFFIWYFYRKSISTFKFSIIFFLGILFIFPLLDLFRYGFDSNLMFSLNTSLDQFKQLHFDAFANLLATIEYTFEYNLLLGSNFLGALLFFIPSNFWEGKPEGSGTRIGNYLIDNYGLNFNNLSNPLVSEFYLSFGMIGIIIGAYIFAQVINKLEKDTSKSLQNEILYGIVLSYLFILLRGSLIVAFSSIIGSIFFMIVLPRLLMIKQNKKMPNSKRLEWR